MSLFKPPDTNIAGQAAALGAQVAQGQQGYNTTAAQDSQRGSMVGQNNQYGNLDYTQTGTSSDGTPLYTAKTTLSPQQQLLFDQLMGTKQAAGAAGGSLISGANYGAVDPSKVIGDATTGNTKALLDQYNQSQQPFFTTQRAQLDTTLRNQGLAPGMPGYDNAMRSMDTSITNAEAGAAANFEPQAYNQAKGNYEEAANLGTGLAGFGASTDPNFIQTPGLNEQPANLIGATSAENSVMADQLKAQQGQYSSLMSGIFGVPSALLGGWAKGGFPGASSLFGGGSAGAAAGAGEAAGGSSLASLAPMLMMA